MTIIEAIKDVLKETKEMTSQQIYDEIILKHLYSFGAKDPKAIVNGQIRKHCLDLDFPTSHPIKYFAISKKEKSQTYYALLESPVTNILPKKTMTLLSSDSLPEEKIQKAYEEHRSSIKNSLLDRIINNHSSFFEQLVVNLLLKMGYGYDEKAGIVTGGPYDHGIDGIIYEDKLGLDLVYIQAKRYGRDKTIGSKDIQAFVGAMENIQKGVFITTAAFSNEALSYAKRQQQKSIKLLDGNQLVELMIDNFVGVTSIKQLNIYKIDSDYFEE